MNMFKKGNRVQLVSDIYGSMIGERGIVTSTCNGMTVSVDWDDCSLPLPCYVFDFQIEHICGETRIVNRDTDTFMYMPSTLSSIPRTSVSALSRQITATAVHDSNIAGYLRIALVFGILIAVSLIGGTAFIALANAANDLNGKLTTIEVINE